MLGTSDWQQMKRKYLEINHWIIPRIMQENEEDNAKYNNSFSLTLSDTKGRVRLPNRMIFWKSAKGGGGVGHFQSKNLYCKFWNFKQGLFEH